MNYRNNEDQYTTRRFDNLMYSDPEHVVFAYSPDARHLRLLEIQKQMKNGDNNGQNDYFHNFRGHNSLSDNFTFIPKRCVMLDNQLTVIEKQHQGQPINYHKVYKLRVNQQLKKRVYSWYTNSDDQHLTIINNHSNNPSLSLFKQYYSYPEINTFCFGRKHFVRSINSIDLSSDSISRSHCELMIKKGKGKDDMERFVEMVFGVNVGKGTMGRYKKEREKLSAGNKLHLLTRQLWQIIYSFIFLSKDKYFLVDNGSRNGTFFIECPKKLLYKRSEQHQPANNEYNAYGQRITINHKLQIKQGYSYQFQGEEYSMKVWRLTESNDFSIIKDHNERTIKCISEFDEKISWFNNFEKANKDYIIDEGLMRRQKWKGKRVYEEMMGKLRERVRQQQVLLQQEQNGFITKGEFVKLICQQLLLQQKILKKHNISSDIQSQEQNNTSFFIEQQILNTIVVSLDFINDYKKIYCIITEANRVCKFHLGSQMVLNTARFQFEESHKCNGYVEFDGKAWAIVALAAVEGREREEEEKNCDSGEESDLQKDSQDLKEQSIGKKNKINNKVTQKSYNLNLYNKLSHKIWTKIPARSLYELNPQKSSTYLIRLSNSFYFKLKFINFENSKAKIGT